MEDRNRIQRKQAMQVGEAIQLFLKQAKLSSGLNTQRIFEAWDIASGASRYTIRRYFRDGKLHVTLNSSVIRSQLKPRSGSLVEEMNRILESDSLFIKDDPNVSYVKELIIK